MVYISSHIGDDKSGGGVVSSANYYAIKKIFPSISVIDINKVSDKPFKNRFLSKGLTLLHSLFNYSAGLSPKILKAIVNSEDVSKSDCIWIDGSLFGILNELLKIKYPSIKIITFFHNVEFDFMSSLGAKRGRFYSYIVKSSCYNESLAIKYSDYIFTLSSSDSNRLKILYNRSSDLVLPVTFESVDISGPCKNTSTDMLFVGSDFPPNVEAIKYLSDKVMPFVNKKLVVVGKGMEKYRGLYNAHNIEIIGFVDDISEYYKKCNIVLTPIFSGAGMKVKVAEALNFGKVVIGTPFSFIGYDDNGNTDSFLIKADNASDYITLISSTYPDYSSLAKSYFDTNYSSQYIERKLRNFFA
jgi:hypothetical protein